MKVVFLKGNLQLTCFSGTLAGESQGCSVKSGNHFSAKGNRDNPPFRFEMARIVPRSTGSG